MKKANATIVVALSFHYGFYLAVLGLLICCWNTYAKTIPVGFTKC